MESDEMITLKEAETLIGVPTDILRHAAQRGALPAKKSGATWLVKPSALRAWANDPTKHKPGKKSRKLGG